jgi:hypothetical protein
MINGIEIDFKTSLLRTIGLNYHVMILLLNFSSKTIQILNQQNNFSINNFWFFPEYTSLTFVPFSKIVPTKLFYFRLANPTHYFISKIIFGIFT